MEFTSSSLPVTFGDGLLQDQLYLQVAKGSDGQVANGGDGLVCDSDHSHPDIRGAYLHPALEVCHVNAL